MPRTLVGYRYLIHSNLYIWRSKVERVTYMSKKMKKKSDHLHSLSNPNGFHSLVGILCYGSVRDHNISFIII